MMWMSGVVEYVVFLVSILIGLAYLTLVERKLMGFVQGRVGPNAVGVFGMLQPIGDGVKLVLKQGNIPSSGDSTFFMMAPIAGFVLAMMSWNVLPAWGSLVDLELDVMYVLMVGSLGVLGVLLAGWSSGSKFAFLGSIRSAAQMLAYELPLGCVLLYVSVVCLSFSFEDFFFSWMNIPLLMLWSITILAETNRTPFDLPEAEAELVAGYNVEYASFGFALFFLAEYAHMLLLAVATVGAFLNPFGFGLKIGSMLLAVFAASYLTYFVWIRALLPRFRYDLLMRFGWKVLLPLAFGFVLLALSVFCALQLSPVSPTESTGSIVNINLNVVNVNVSNVAVVLVSSRFGFADLMLFSSGLLFLFAESPVFAILGAIFLILTSAFFLYMLHLDLLALSVVLVFVGGLSVLFLFATMLSRH